MNLSVNKDTQLCMSLAARPARQYGYSWQPELKSLRPALIINNTPIGMAGGRESRDLSFSEQAIEAARCVFDVVAIPAETPLILHAKALSKQLISGAEVIVPQAVEQFVLYTGVRPKADLVERAAVFARS